MRFKTISRNKFDPAIHNEKGTCYKLAEPVYKLELNGEIITEYDSIADASRMPSELQTIGYT